MDILYYSNECQHCKKLLEYITRNGLIEQLNCICIDKRSKDPNTGQIFVYLPTGKCVLIPPNIGAVPALMIRKDNFRTIYAKDIVHYLNPFVSAKISQISKINGEPMPMQLGSATGSSTANIVSEKYTYYAGQSEGRGPTNPNYVSATDESPFSIQTPDETYKPNKLSNGDVTIEILKQKRDTDIPDSLPNPYGF